ncbi:hypothetical protein [Chitinimonas sp.]|uniref:glycine-rich domain-containing protein n=1 Tax=Chitinimonas sp. TaxID=1934313 RepID=UPI002F9511D2
MLRAILLLILLPVLGWLVYRLWQAWQQTAGKRFIETYVFPASLEQKLADRYPMLDARGRKQVEQGLRQFFAISLLARGQRLGMPSQAVDMLWHEFILHTRNYQHFCRRAFGRFLHHTPAAGMAGAGQQRRAIRRSWQLSCRLEGLNPAKPGRLPLLFGLDAALAIPGGFHYVVDCQQAVQDGSASSPFCGSDVDCSSGGCSSEGGGTADGHHGGHGGDSDGGGGDGGGGDGGGCSGGGCGGGD